MTTTLTWRERLAIEGARRDAMTPAERLNEDLRGYALWATHADGRQWYVRASYRHRTTAEWEHKFVVDGVATGYGQGKGGRERKGWTFSEYARDVRADEANGNY
jgi:hypothetical protein